MTLFSSGKRSTKDGVQPVPRPVSPAPAKEVDIPMWKIDDVIRRTAMIPGGGGKNFYTLQERQELQKEVRKALGTHLEEGEKFEKTKLFRQLLMERGKAKDNEQKWAADRKIRYMEKVIKQAREEMQGK
jgi:hypothetical protein